MAELYCEVTIGYNPSRTATSSSLRHRIAAIGGGGGGCGGAPGAAAGCWGGCGVMKVSVNAAWEPWAALGVSALGRPRRLRAGMQHLGRRRRQSHSAATLYTLYREPPVKYTGWCWNDFTVQGST